MWLTDDGWKGYVGRIILHGDVFSSVGYVVRHCIHLTPNEWD